MSITYQDLPFSSPEETLAIEETLLETCNKTGVGTLRFWESPSLFIVLGRSRKIDEDIYEERCQKDGIPILRRCSGGGTVLQGKGCLNYALIAPIDKKGPYQTIQSTNEAVMVQIRDALLPHHPDIDVKGITDLAIKGIKFSGNAQRRLKNAFLFHGTFLYNYDLTTISTYLKMPPIQPDYRNNRPHKSFVRNLPLTPEVIQAALIKKFVE
ncbi:lipoate--protein ligase family protein [bacterium]|jgi:lipoate---protein ligase|nr:lipoate--protein ligase family protein [bacterium]